MILPDVNLVVFAYNEAAPRHQAARAWWEKLMTGREAPPDVESPLHAVRPEAIP